MPVVIKSEDLEFEMMSSMPPLPEPLGEDDFFAMAGQPLGDEPSFMELSINSFMLPETSSSELSHHFFDDLDPGPAVAASWSQQHSRLP